MAALIAPAPAWLEPTASADEQCDRTWFLDHRRRHRLRPASPGTAVVRYDGVIHYVRQPWEEFAELHHEAFAKKIFTICEKAAPEAA